MFKYLNNDLTAWWKSTPIRKLKNELIKRKLAPDIKAMDIPNYFASQIIDRYRRDYPRSKIVPMNVQKLKTIGSNRRISSIEKMDMQPNARIFFDGTSATFKIEYSALRTSKSRAIFSVAHEIGHTFFYDIRRTIPESLVSIRDFNSKTVEAFCHEFASNLIIPKKEFIDTSEKYGISQRLTPETIIRLAKTFNASHETIIKRIGELSLLNVSQEVIVGINWRCDFKNRYFISAPDDFKKWGVKNMSDLPHSMNHETKDVICRIGFLRRRLIECDGTIQRIKGTPYSIGILIY